MAIKFAIIESQNPIDIFYGRDESSSLLSALKLFGNKALIMHARSANNFTEICDYLATSNGNHCSVGDDGDPIFVHISSHGNDSGLEIGKDFIEWEQVAKNISKISENNQYRGSVCLSISSCGSGTNKIHKEIEKNLNKNKIEYIFSIPGETIGWDAALAAWIVLYYNISRYEIDKANIQESLKRTWEGTRVLIKYNRYDEKKNKYLTWSPKNK